LLIPVFSALLAWVFLDEPISLAQGAAMAVVIGALAVVVRGQSQAPSALPPALDTSGHEAAGR
jgi:drug/metabolite transporter (DMT)-like permease